MRKSLLFVIMSICMILSSTHAVKKVALRGKLISSSIRTIPTNIDDCVQAFLDNKTVSVEFLKLFRYPVTLSVLDEDDNVVFARVGLIFPNQESFNLDNCTAGSYVLIIQDTAGSYVYGHFDLE